VLEQLASAHARIEEIRDRIYGHGGPTASLIRERTQVRETIAALEALVAAETVT
jgi:rRNA processing protein Krr1/Pno1